MNMNMNMAMNTQWSTRLHHFHEKYTLMSGSVTPSYHQNQIHHQMFTIQQINHINSSMFTIQQINHQIYNSSIKFSVRNRPMVKVERISLTDDGSFSYFMKTNSILHSGLVIGPIPFPTPRGHVEVELHVEFALNAG